MSNAYENAQFILSDLQYRFEVLPELQDLGFKEKEDLSIESDGNDGFIIRMTPENDQGKTDGVRCLANGSVYLFSAYDSIPIVDIEVPLTHTTIANAIGKMAGQLFEEIMYFVDADDDAI